MSVTKPRSRKPNPPSTSTSTSEILKTITQVLLLAVALLKLLPLLGF
jgi:hypothetical protein